MKNSQIIDNSTILITGGTGSFGETFLKKLLPFKYREIRILSRDEKKQEDMRIKYNNSKIKFFIGDVRNLDSINDAIQGVDYIFHAAALKQVPSCEFYPMEAVQTNIIGTQNVIQSSIDNNVKKTIILSTDKAVYPINAMGISKSMAEKLMLAKARNNSKTILCATRYGNVMASRGSVIPLFISLIKSEKSLKIPDPNMTRFLMSLDQSVDLVFHALKYSNNGDIFVKKSPASKLIDLSNALLSLFNSKSSIEIIGTRHGEKLYETLVSREEMAIANEDENFFQIPLDNRDLNYSLYFTEGSKNISKLDDYTSHNTKQLELNEIKSILLNLEYVKEMLSV